MKNKVSTLDKLNARPVTSAAQLRAQKNLEAYKKTQEILVNSRKEVLVEKTELTNDTALVKPNTKLDPSLLFDVPGIYFLYNDDILIYIGESKCVMSRVRTHFTSDQKNFNRFSYEIFQGTDKERKAKEAKLIRKFRPVVNMTHNPDMRLTRRKRR